MMNKAVIIILALSVYLDDSIVDAAVGVATNPPFLTATASSTYANNAGCYGPTFGIDGYSDNSGCNFFHSAGSTYPWFAAVLIPDAVNPLVSVTLKSRCDANGWGHTQFTLVVRAGATPVTTALNAGTSLLTQNTLCGSFTGTVPQCSTKTITCATSIAAAAVLTVQLYTSGTQNVHLMFEDVTIVRSTTAPAVATSSSVYYCPYGDFKAYWGPDFAIDGAQSGTWWGMFHSCHETYPWLQIQIPAATVTSVSLRSRCDANAWSCSVPNNINVEVRAGTVATATSFKGQITSNVQCGTKIGCDASACMTHKITCATPALLTTYITVQMLDATKTFLMLDQVTWA